MLWSWLVVATVSAAADPDRVENLPGLPARFQSVQYAGLLDASTPDTAAAGKQQLFYWLIMKERAATTDADTDATPIVLWLQGGPGASSLFGLFSENGPFRVTTAITASGTPSDGHPTLLKLELAPVRWTTAAHMLYLQPFGTGFSFANSNTLAGVVHNETCGAL